MSRARRRAGRSAPAGMAEPGQFRGLGLVVPQAVRAEQQGPGPGRRVPLHVRGAVGSSARSAASPPSQRVSTCACGEAIAAASSARPAVTISPATRVIPREQPRTLDAGWLEPVGAAVAQPAQASRLVAARSTADTNVVADVSPPGPCRAATALGAAAATEAERGRGEIPARLHRGHQHRQRGLRGRLRRLVGTGRGRHAVADHRHHRPDRPAPARRPGPSRLRYGRCRRPLSLTPAAGPRSTSAWSRGDGLVIMCIR